MESINIFCPNIDYNFDDFGLDQKTQKKTKVKHNHFVDLFCNTKTQLFKKLIQFL
jgi:hypothetical protein